MVPCQGDNGDTPLEAWNEDGIKLILGDACIGERELSTHGCPVHLDTGVLDGRQPAGGGSSAQEGAERRRHLGRVVCVTRTVTSKSNQVCEGARAVWGLHLGQGGARADSLATDLPPRWHGGRGANGPGQVHLSLAGEGTSGERLHPPRCGGLGTTPLAVTIAPVHAGDGSGPPPSYAGELRPP